MKALLPLMLLFPIAAMAQQDTTVVEQYCEVKFQSPLFSGKVAIDMNHGNKKNMHQENLLRDEQGKAILFRTVIEALNYMGRKGWTLVNVYPITPAGTTPTYYYLFKKLFRKQELAEQSPSVL
jgi:hypothetical protein